MKAHSKKKRHQCEKPIYALDVPCRCTNMETSPFDRANGSSSARCGKQAARTPHKSEKCNVGRSSIGTGCRLSLLGCGYPFCWKPRRIRGSWVPTFVDSSPSYTYIYIYICTYIFGHLHINWKPPMSLLPRRPELPCGTSGSAVGSSIKGLPTSARTKGMTWGMVNGS